MDLLVFQIAIALTVVVFAVNKKKLFPITLTIQLVLLSISSFWAVEVLISGANYEQNLMLVFWGSPLKITIDALSAFFILVLNFTMFTGVLYARGYLRHYLASKNRVEFSLHHFSFLWLHVSMLLVCMIRDGLAFLVVWELMSISSFFLVIFESEKKETVRTGIKYLLQMHIGLAFIMAGFLYAYVKTGAELSLEGLSVYFETFNPFPLFLLFFIGFGIKAGFIPLHSWLPHAHPAAPSHVSGVMSGVMIKMGIYGILRVLTYIHSDLLPIGIFILVISLVSGLLGVMYAIAQHDVKKLLAYHSIENIGIIGIGIGCGVIGLAKDIPVLAVLGFTGGILHVLNHSLFKSLLFYAAGSVYLKTHTRNIEKLGGLIKKMPKTALLFLLAALAICGLPPFNGFISEFLIYSGLFKGLQTGGFESDLIILFTFVGLALIGGLAIFCFTKVFGIVFLGTPRSTSSLQASEVNNSMLLPQIMVGLLIVGIGLFPVFFMGMASKVTVLYVGDISWLSSSSPILLKVRLASLLFISLTTILWFIRRSRQKKVEVTYGPTWGCGYTGANPATNQYTAASFANNFQELASPIFQTEKHYKVLKEEDIFPQARKFETHSNDIIEEYAIEKPVQKLLAWMKKAAIFQTGKLQNYILYAFAFLVLIFLLTFLKII